MPSVSTRLRHAMAANSWTKKGRRTSNKERDRELMTVTKKRMVNRRMSGRRRIR